MRLTKNFFHTTLSIAAIAAFIGCASKDETTTNSDPMSTVPDMVSPDGGESEGLSAADQALADAQKICPVSDSELGSMGTPIKVMVNEQPVFICCEHCKEPLLAEPDKFLQKLADAKAVQEAGDTSEGQTDGSQPAT